MNRAIAQTLDRLHAELAGKRKPCRWAYDGARDIYSCPHLTLTGGQVIGATEYLPVAEGNNENSEVVALQ